jgi:dienelactone hydrolase
VALVPTDLELWVGNPADSTAGTRAFRRFGFTELLAGGTPSGASPLIRSGVEIDPASERISKSTVKPKPRAAEATMPVTYQLAPQPFDTELEPWLVSGGVARYRVRFPSPLTTPDPENNTVHAELFQPVAPGPFPCVIVLHIAGGDFELSRFAAQVFAQREVAALFVKMPYYGERRPAGKRTRMVSNDLEVGLRSMRQVVLDLRRACDWIEAQPSLDGQRIGVMGISLGAITGALASAIEPRISHACLVMGGAELQHILFESTEREAVEYRKLWRANGGTLETFADVMRPYDPATYADRLRQRIVFMISAADDQTIPKKSTLALWEATGRQRIVWYPCGHYTMAKYLLPALTQASVFFREWPTERAHE